MAKNRDIQVEQDDGGDVAVTLTALGEKKLKGAASILSLVSKLPCRQKQLAATTAKDIGLLLGKLAKPAPADTDSDNKESPGPIGKQLTGYDLLQSLLSRVPGASFREADTVEGEALAANQSGRLANNDLRAAREACQKRREEIVEEEDSDREDHSAAEAEELASR